MTAEGIAWGDVLRSLAAQLAWFQAALLTAAAVHKMVHWRRTRSVVLSFAGVPQKLAGWAGAVAVGVELSAAVALVFADTRAAGAAAAAALWSIYLGFLLRARLSGRRDVDCGCSFGMRPDGGHRAVGAFQIMRNAALVTMAAVVVVAAHGSGDAALSQALAACALLALYAALDQVMTLRPLRSGEVL